MHSCSCVLVNASLRSPLSAKSIDYHNLSFNDLLLGAFGVENGQLACLPRSLYSSLPSLTGFILASSTKLLFLPWVLQSSFHCTICHHIPHISRNPPPPSLSLVVYEVVPSICADKIVHDAVSVEFHLVDCTYATEKSIKYVYFCCRVACRAAGLQFRRIYCPRLLSS